MSKAKIGLAVVTIILFSTGIWQIAIAALGALIYISTVQQPQKTNGTENIESLRAENEELKRKLGEKLVDDVISKTENREGR
jgi:hypothetical protein